MSELRARQLQMLNYLMGQPSEIQAHIRDHGTIDAATRLHIYRNAYQVRFWETIDNDHPILGSYLGDDMFNQMVRDYIEQHPSKFRSLRNFADALPEFLVDYPVFADYPHIAELAKFERLLMDAFDARDEQPCDRQALLTLPAELWPAATFKFHPSLRAFRCQYNSVELWQHLKAERQPPEAAEEQSYWLIWRNRERLTEFTSLDSYQATLFEGFFAGQTLAEAAELAQPLASDPAQQLLQTLLDWLDKGMVLTIQSNSEAAQFSGEQL